MPEVPFAEPDIEGPADVMGAPVGADFASLMFGATQRPDEPLSRMPGQARVTRVQDTLAQMVVLSGYAPDVQELYDAAREYGL